MLTELKNIALQGNKDLETWYNSHFIILNREYPSDWSGYELSFFQCITDCEIDNHEIKTNEVIAFKADSISFRWYKVNKGPYRTIEECFVHCYAEVEKAYQRFME